MRIGLRTVLFLPATSGTVRMAPSPAHSIKTRIDFLFKPGSKPRLSRAALGERDGFRKQNPWFCGQPAIPYRREGTFSSDTPARQMPKGQAQAPGQAPGQASD
jgi:hypothetical protein